MNLVKAIGGTLLSLVAIVVLIGGGVALVQDTNAAVAGTDASALNFAFADLLVVLAAGFTVATVIPATSRAFSPVSCGNYSYDDEDEDDWEEEDDDEDAWLDPDYDDEDFVDVEGDDLLDVEEPLVASAVSSDPWGCK